MKITPFIKPIKLQGGTFYTCSSAQEDLQLALSESKNKFRFSKFALLKIPKLQSWRVTNEALAKDEHFPNYFQAAAVRGAFDYFNDNDGNPNTNNSFAESFQNYYLNAETTISANSEYVVQNKRTISERLFFKWLKEAGAIRFREANTKEFASAEGSKSTTGAHYVEEDESFDGRGNYIYERVVKYIGNINVNNAVKDTQNSYTEVYMHVPTSHGSTKNVLFTSIEDENYKAGSTYRYDPIDNRDEPYLYGRKYSDVNPSGVENRAFYDSAANWYNMWVWDKDDQKWYDYHNDKFYWWFPTETKCSYKLDNGRSNKRNATVYDGATLASAENDIFCIGEDPNDENNTENVKVVRSRLDGVSLEFDINHYGEAAKDSTIESMSQYNAKYGQSFSFNTVLVYYDVYDVDNPYDSVTNLFGVLFLDNVDEQLDGAEIESITKYKPSKVLQQNGNSYAFKLNIKFDLSAQDSAVELDVDTYNTASMELFMDALTEMKKNASLLQQHMNTYSKLETKVDRLISLVQAGATYEDLKSQVDELQTKFDNANSLFISNDKLTEMLERNYDEIRRIYNNGTMSVNMSYNMDAIQSGSGIEIDRSSERYSKISVTKQSFNIVGNPIIELSTDANSDKNQYTYTAKLKEFDNYLRIDDGDVSNDGSPFKPDRNVVILIDDTDIDWKAGQRFRISFSHGLDLDNEKGKFAFNIWTDAKDKTHNGYKFGKQIDSLNDKSFSDKSGKPVIEIICIDEENLDFVVDIF